MQALNGRLILSPSDLNDYVECAHLTTLGLEKRLPKEIDLRSQRA